MAGIKQKRVIYVFPAFTTRPQTLVESDHVPAQVIGGFVYVRLRPIGTYGTFVHLTIRKTNLSPITVDITMEVKSVGKFEKSAYEWRDSCEFSPRLFDFSGLAEITCVIAITWQIPDVPAVLTDSPRTLALSAENFLMSSSFSDVTIVIGTEELPAHKVILDGYSSVFCQMLSTPMKEAETSRITIEDIDVDTMKSVLTFLYKGKCEALSEVPVASKVLAAAHKYDIPPLQDTCVNNLYKQVNLENVVTILELADLYGKEQLKQVCWEFIMKNKAVISTVEFRDLCRTNDGIMEEFTAKVVKALP